MDKRAELKAVVLGSLADRGITGIAARRVVQGLTGFLQKLATIKQANGLLERIADGSTGYLLPALTFAPPIAGAGLGYLAAKATDVQDVDVDELKRREMIDLLQAQTRHLNATKKPLRPTL